MSRDNYDDDEYDERPRRRGRRSGGCGTSILTLIVLAGLVVGAVLFADDIKTIFNKQVSRINGPPIFKIINQSVSQGVDDPPGSQPDNGVDIAGTREAYTHLVDSPQPSAGFASACFDAGGTPATSNRYADGTSSARCNLLNMTKEAAEAICAKLGGTIKHEIHIVREGDQAEFSNCLETEQP